MSTWYRVPRWGTTIEPIEVVKETAHFVTIRSTSTWGTSERREAKNNDHFPTFAEARTYLLNRLSSKIEKLRQQADACREEFSQVFMMEAPKENQ